MGEFIPLKAKPLFSLSFPRGNFFSCLILVLLQFMSAPSTANLLCFAGHSLHWDCPRYSVHLFCRWVGQYQIELNWTTLHPILSSAWDGWRCSYTHSSIWTRFFVHPGPQAIWYLSPSYPWNLHSPWFMASRWIHILRMKGLRWNQTLCVIFWINQTKIIRTTLLNKLLHFHSPYTQGNSDTTTL